MIFDTTAALQDVLKERLNCRMIRVAPGTTFRKISEELYEINPGESADYRRLIAELRETKQLPAAIIYRWRYQISGFDTGLDQKLQKGIYALYHLSQVLMLEAPGQSVTLLYLYPGDRETAPPEDAALGGFARTVRLEQPLYRYKTVALPDRLELAEEALVIERELWNPDFGIEICYEAGQRYLRQIEELKETSTVEPGLCFRERGVYLITGGAGGLGLIFAEYLAHNFRARLVLIGRSELTPNLAEKLNAFEAWGAEALYFRADVADPSCLEEVIREVKSRYQIIHG
jgi:polyketide synthase PksN